MPNPKPMKTDPKFREWLQQRQGNIQKMLGIPPEVVKVTMMDTQRIIARTDGVQVTKELIKKFKSK